MLWRLAYTYINHCKQPGTRTIWYIFVYLVHFYRSLRVLRFYFPAQPVGGFTLSDLLSGQASVTQVSCLLSPGMYTVYYYCIHHAYVRRSVEEQCRRCSVLCLLRRARAAVQSHSSTHSSTLLSHIYFRLVAAYSREGPLEEHSR